MKDFMRKPEPSLQDKVKKVSKNFPFWYLLFMLLLVWLWQAAIGQYAVRTIPYSEFKQALKNGEVVECLVREDAVEGKIQPKVAANAPAAETGPPPAGSRGENQHAAGSTKPYLFRAIRVEDSKLADELEAAGVKFTGARPNMLFQF